MAEKKKSKKAKAKEFAYKAAETIGNGVRKVGPWVLTAITVVGLSKFGGGNHSDKA